MLFFHSFHSFASLFHNKLNLNELFLYILTDITSNLNDTFNFIAAVAMSVQTIYGQIVSCGHKLVVFLKMRDSISLQN